MKLRETEDRIKHSTGSVIPGGLSFYYKCTYFITICLEISSKARVVI